jgi:hypothetical protein
MVYRICGGLFFLVYGLVSLGMAIPAIIVGILAIIAGVALLAGK